MKVEQIYTGCLAQGAYYIESKGEAVVIDPLREVQSYLDTARRDGAKIKYVLETHFHADFVSGHIDLAKQTGATIVFGPNAAPSFDAHIAKDNEVLKVGEVSIKVLHTPGHTMESVSYLLLDKDEKPYAVFSGDTLFLGDVGRPDLAAKSNFTEAQLAETLYDSLRNKIMVLPDDVIVYPGHGAGSACGKNMRKETVGSIGEEKRTNYALRADMSKTEFVKEVITGLAPPPSYFPKNVMMNRNGYESINTVLDRGLRSLSPEAFEAAANETGALVLDTRHQDDFVKGFIPKSIFIGIDGGFAPWVGTLVPDITQPILIVADKGREKEVVTRLARVGYDNSIGFLEGGFESWKKASKEVDSLESIRAHAFAERNNNQKLNIVDVRKPGEYQAEHVENADNRPLDFINDKMSEFDKDQPAYLYCAGGYRSVIASSILKARGYNNLVNVETGFPGIKEAGVTCTAYVCPSTLA
ncbi:MBL fold metallo-hydrolase [Cryomorpha ignava]|uniref:MBL fold metallo-hydrolase n=1 Tax=Cryomorpha ignava TaxID=101383 RepID=A0A7K3WUC7_9FLAO|nr:MBL fold metallo-hydrolase [Cryomorpha ignava]NEN25283.1 MBL fold metallo-hydrolase [Cryomorpha ignava]